MSPKNHEKSLHFPIDGLQLVNNVFCCCYFIYLFFCKREEFNQHLLGKVRILNPKCVLSLYYVFILEFHFFMCIQMPEHFNGTNLITPGC